MRHPYAEFLHLVEKPARYVGGEYHETVKNPDAVGVRMALAFPDVYDIGMSHLGTRILYALVNAEPDLAVERAFCPWTDCERELRARSLPLVTLETATPLGEFDAHRRLAHGGGADHGHDPGQAFHAPSTAFR